MLAGCSVPGTFFLSLCKCEFPHLAAPLSGTPIGKNALKIVKCYVKKSVKKMVQCYGKEL